VLQGVHPGAEAVVSSIDTAIPPTKLARRSGFLTCCFAEVGGSWFLAVGSEPFFYSWRWCPYLDLYSLDSVNPLC